MHYFSKNEGKNITNTTTNYDFVSKHFVKLQPMEKLFSWRLDCVYLAVKKMPFYDYTSNRHRATCCLLMHIVLIQHSLSVISVYTVYSTMGQVVYSGL